MTRGAAAVANRAQDKRQGRRPPDEGQVLVEFDRRGEGHEAAERLRVALKEFKGKQYVDARVWYGTSDGAWLPTKRGVTLRLGELGALRDALAEAIELTNSGGPHS